MSSTSSMRATYSASTLGMHHMSFCQGLRWFSAKRRRTVSRDKLSWSVSLTIAPASSSSVQRARPSGGLEQAVEEGFLVAGQLTIGACPRLLVQGGFEITFNEAALGPVNGRAADSHSSGDIF